MLMNPLPVRGASAAAALSSLAFLALAVEAAVAFRFDPGAAVVSGSGGGAAEVEGVSREIQEGLGKERGAERSIDSRSSSSASSQAAKGRQW